MQWDGNFESVPKGRDFGSSTATVLRSIKTECQSRFSVEHTWDSTTTPECLHKAGECSVVQLVDDTPSLSNFVIGGLIYDYVNHVLYRDTGLTLIAISGLDHDSLTLNMTAADAHSLYVQKAGDTVTDITVPAANKIEGLQTIETGYTASDVMECAMHINENDAPHDDQVVTAVELVSIPTSKLAWVLETSTTSTTPGDNAVEFVVGRYATFPMFADDNLHTGYLRLQPLFNITPPDDWAAGFTFGGITITPGYTLKLQAHRLDYT